MEGNEKKNCERNKSFGPLLCIFLLLSFLLIKCLPLFVILSFRGFHFGASSVGFYGVMVGESRKKGLAGFELIKESCACLFRVKGLGMDGGW
jgi:hypothetical protein